MAIRYHITPKGAMKMEIPKDYLHGGDGAQLGEKSLSHSESKALRWLAELEGTRPEGSRTSPLIKTYNFGGHDWHIMQGNAEDVARAGLWSARDATGRLHLLTTGVFTSFLAGVYHVYLMRSADELQPEFPDYRDAYELAASTHPLVAEINGLLFEAILALNPALKPKQLPDDAAPAKDDTPPLA